VALYASTVVMWFTSDSKFRIDGVAIRWAAAVVAVALAWVVGFVLPWDRTTYVMTTSSWTFNATGTNTLTRDCCAAFSQRPTISTREVMVIVAVLGLATVLPFVLPRAAAAVGVVALGAALLGDSISWLWGLSQPVNVSGLPNASESGMYGTHTGLPGGWLSAVATVVLILLAVFMLLGQSMSIGRARQFERS
jgi:hypothetical protein